MEIVVMLLNVVQNQKFILYGVRNDRLYGEGNQRKMTVPHWEWARKGGSFIRNA